MRTDFQRYPPGVREEALRSTGIQPSDRATAADFGELLAACAQVCADKAEADDAAAAQRAVYESQVRATLEAMDDEILALELKADALEFEADLHVERADDYATAVCNDTYACAGGGMAASKGRVDAAELREEASNLREQATHLREERNGLQTAVFGGELNS